MGVVYSAAIDLLGYSCKPESQPRRLALFVVLSTKTFLCCDLAERAARNAPKRHSSHFCRAGVFAAVVAQSIQNMSPVSITDKTAGIDLPRLWYGAIGAESGVDKIPPGPKLDALTAEKVFVHQHNDRGGIYGKWQDKAGHWRLAKASIIRPTPLMRIR